MQGGNAELLCMPLVDTYFRRVARMQWIGQRNAQCGFQGVGVEQVGATGFVAEGACQLELPTNAQVVQKFVV